MGLGQGIVGFFRAIEALLTGKLWRKTKGINENPDVVRARYQDIIRKKAQRIVVIQEAVAGLKRTLTQEVQRLGALRREIRETEEAIGGADAFIEQRAQQLKQQGKTRDLALQDAEIQGHLSSKADFESSLAQMKQRASEMDGYITTAEGQVQEYLIELRSLQRDLEQTRTEMDRSVADVAIASEKRALERALQGITQDTTESDLQQLRDTVAQVRAEADVATEVSGSRVTIQREKYKEAARRRMASTTGLDKVFGATEQDKVAVGKVAEKAADLPVQ